MDFHRFLWFSIDLTGSGTRMSAARWQPVAACGGLSRRIRSPIRNISGGLEDVADRWEEGIARTKDIEDFLEELRI